MTPSELRAAAEREIESLENGSLYAISQPADGHCYCVQQRTIQTLELMAEHILATVRDDDKLPVTEEWLLSIGGEAKPSHIGPEYSDNVRIGDLGLWDFNGECWLMEGEDRFELKTRGQVRDLCRALQIELKETP